MYRFSNSPVLCRRTKVVLPTPPSPTRMTLNLGMGGARGASSGAAFEGLNENGAKEPNAEVSEAISCWGSDGFLGAASLETVFPGSLFRITILRPGDGAVAATSRSSCSSC